MAKRSSDSSLQQRKRQLEARLSAYGLDNNDTATIAALNEENISITPVQAAERLLILLAVSFTAYSFQESDKVMEWLKKEGLWTNVSETEKDFFRSPDPSEETKAKLSWRFEAAYMIAWALQEVMEIPDATKECGEDAVGDFFSNVPSVGVPTGDFCSGARFRPAHEILDEYVFYEGVNAYLMDIAASQKENTSGIHAKAAPERLNALRWLTAFEEKTNWDDIIPDEDL